MIQIFDDPLFVEFPVSLTRISPVKRNTGFITPILNNSNFISTGDFSLVIGNDPAK